MLCTFIIRKDYYGKQTVCFTWDYDCFNLPDNYIWHSPHKALTCICDTLNWQKVKQNIRFFIF